MSHLLPDIFVSVLLIGSLILDILLRRAQLVVIKRLRADVDRLQIQQPPVGVEIEGIAVRDSSGVVRFLARKR